MTFLEEAKVAAFVRGMDPEEFMGVVSLVDDEGLRKLELLRAGDVKEGKGATQSFSGLTISWKFDREVDPKEMGCHGNC